jgi:hypothetical protein
MASSCGLSPSEQQQVQQPVDARGTPQQVALRRRIVLMFVPIRVSVQGDATTRSEAFLRHTEHQDSAIPLGDEC